MAITIVQEVGQIKSDPEKAGSEDRLFRRGRLVAVVAQVVLKPVELFMVYWFSEETVTAEHLPDGTVLERNIDTFGRNAGFELTAGGSRVVATEYAYSIKGRGNCKITLVSEENG